MTCEEVYVSGYRRGQPCPYKATEVIATVAYSLQVCGYHARQYTPDVRYPLAWNLARIRSARLSSKEAGE